MVDGDISTVPLIVVQEMPNQYDRRLSAEAIPLNTLVESAPLFRLSVHMATRSKQEPWCVASGFHTASRILPVLASLDC